MVNYITKRKHYRKPALCRVPEALPSVFYRALGKDGLCRVPNKTHSAKKTLDKMHLCRVPKKTLGKAVFAECPIKYTRQSFRHSAKCRFPVVYIILNQE